MAETIAKPKVIAVDFDGTLAHYTGWKGHDHLGEPVPEMVERVKQEIAKGNHVRIFTARAYWGDTQEEAMQATEAVLLIAAWCKQHIGQVIPVSCIKTRDIDEFWDDRGRQVIDNTGVLLHELPERIANGATGSGRLDAAPNGADGPGSAQAQT